MSIIACDNGWDAVDSSILSIYCILWCLKGRIRLRHTSEYEHALSINNSSMRVAWWGNFLHSSDVHTFPSFRLQVQCVYVWIWGDVCIKNYHANWLRSMAEYSFRFFYKTIFRVLHYMIKHTACEPRCRRGSLHTSNTKILKTLCPKIHLIRLLRRRGYGAEYFVTKAQCRTPTCCDIRYH